MEPEFGGASRGFFPTKDKLQIQCRDKKTFSKKLLYCIKLHDRGKLEAGEDTCTGQVNQHKNFKNVLADWLDGWDHGKVSDKITVQTG